MATNLRLHALLAQACCDANAVYSQYASADPARQWTTLSNEEQTELALAVAKTLAARTASPAANHAQWLADHKAAGWEYAQVEDRANKKSPYLTEWDQLPAAAQGKSALYLAILHPFYGA